MQDFEVIWTQNAEFDLEVIIEYIKIDSIDKAKNIFFEIKEVSKKLNILPSRNRIVPEFQQIGITKYREMIYKRWRIIYKIDEHKVYVLVVADTSRNLEDILFQRLIQNNTKLDK